MLQRRYYNFILDSIDASRCKSIFRLLKISRSDAITELELWFNRVLPNSKAVAVSSARFGLAVLLEHLVSNYSRGRANVIIPGLSCIVVSNAVRAAGCEVRYADIAPDTLNISIATAKNLIDENTIAIVVQHVFGLTDIETIKELKNSYPSIQIIEDCAHALGGRYGNHEFVGAAGDFAFYSFEQSKMVTAWTGGVVVGKDAKAIDAVRKAHQKCRPSDPQSNFRIFTKLISHYWGYRKWSGTLRRLIVRGVDKLLCFESSISMSERHGLFRPYSQIQFSKEQAACILDQLCFIEENVKHRQNISKIYASMLTSRFTVSDCAAVLRYPLLVSDKRAFIANCSDKGLSVGDWFSTPVHPCDPLTYKLDYQPGSCPQAEFFAQHIVNLPTALQIDTDDARRIADIVLAVEPRLAFKGAEHV